MTTRASVAGGESGGVVGLPQWETAEIVISDPKLQGRQITVKTAMAYIKKFATAKKFAWEPAQ